MSYPGYACAPYLHTHRSVELKEAWIASDNVERLFFVTGTFSSDSKPYFAASANHYLLAKFADSRQIAEDLREYNQDKISFVFNIKDSLFRKEAPGRFNFVSVCYLEYGEGGEDSQEIANILLKRDQIEQAGLGHMDTFCLTPSKFTFPFSESITVIEVASEKSYQSVNKYCEQTRREAARRGLRMTNLMSLSILDRLK